MAEPIRHEIIAGTEDQRLVLAGPPARLTGNLHVHNRSDTHLVLRDVGLTDPSGVLTIGRSRQKVSTLVLRPHQERRVLLRLALPSTTPPGEFHAELEIVGQSRPIELHVTEVVDLTVTPQSIVVLNRRGERQHRRIVVTNDGNLAFTIGDFGDVDLEDDVIPDRAVRLALEQCAGIGKDKIEGPLLALLRIRDEGAWRRGGLSVRRLGENIEIAPGATTAIDLEITLETELPPNSRYRGTMPLLTRDLEIVIVSSDGPLESAPRIEA